MTKRAYFLVVAVVLAILALILALLAGRGLWRQWSTPSTPPAVPSAALSASPTNSLDEYDERYQRVVADVRAVGLGAPGFVPALTAARDQLLLLTVPADRRQRHLQAVLLLDDMRATLTADSTTDVSALYQQFLAL